MGLWLMHCPANPMKPQLAKERLGSIPLLHFMVSLTGIAPKASRHNVANVMGAAFADRLNVLDLHVATVAAIRATVAKFIEPLAKR